MSPTVRIDYPLQKEVAEWDSGILDVTAELRVVDPNCQPALLRKDLEVAFGSILIQCCA